MKAESALMYYSLRLPRVPRTSCGVPAVTSAEFLLLTYISLLVSSQNPFTRDGHSLSQKCSHGIRLYDIE